MPPLARRRPSRRSTSVSTINTDDDDCSLGSNISTECHDSLFYDELEKILADNNNSECDEDNIACINQETRTQVLQSTQKKADTKDETQVLAAQPIIIGKLQDRLIQKHLKVRKLRRVVSHNTMSSIQEDVNTVNAAADGSRRMRSVLSFGDMAPRPSLLNSGPGLGGIEEESFSAPMPNAVFDGGERVQPVIAPTLLPHPNTAHTAASPATGLMPFSPPPPLGGKGSLRRAHTIQATARGTSSDTIVPAAVGAGRAMLGIPRPTIGGKRTMRRAQSDTPTMRPASMKISIEEFSALLRQPLGS